MRFTYVKEKKRKENHQLSWVSQKSCSLYHNYHGNQCLKKTTQRLRLYVLFLKMKVPLLDLRNVLSLIVRVHQMTDLINIWLSLQKCVIVVTLKTKKPFIFTPNPCVPALPTMSHGGGCSCLHLIFVFSQKTFLSVSHRGTRWGLLDSCGPLLWGLWLSAEKLSKFDSSQVCSEMPFFKRQKAFASNSGVP